MSQKNSVRLYFPSVSDVNYTASQKKDPRHYWLQLEEGWPDFNSFWYMYS